MDIHTRAFLEQYPLSIGELQAIDAANNGDASELLKLLSSYHRGVSKLSVQQSPSRAASAIGLTRYYRGKISCLIKLLGKKELRVNLTAIYLGEE